MLNGCAADNSTNNQLPIKQRVIVIGAGVSGLAAAKHMRENGIEVIVLEGRDRIGGRVWTIHTANGGIFDMGASWIHGVENNPIANLAQKLSLSTSETDYDNSVIYNANGQTELTLDTRLDTFQQLFSEEHKASIENDSEGSIQDVVDNVLANQGQGRASLSEINFLLNTRLEHEFAADIETLSVLAPIEGEVFPGSDVLLINGYDQIIDYLARDIDVQLNHIVTKIDYSSNGVNVVANSQNFFADKVLVTVPLGVLKKGGIRFVPKLPSNKLHAIDGLGMGVLNKVYLQFPTVFWDNNVHLINIVSDSMKGEWAEWLNLSVYTGVPTLLAFNAGEFGTEIESLTDSEISNDAMNVLRKIYGNDIPEPTNVLISRWHNDPFSYGAYSYLKKGADAAMREKLSNPVKNKLYFAGEATSKNYPATVHGAYLSGMREAKRIFSD